jgi:hypothetical protein
MVAGRRLQESVTQKSNEKEEDNGENALPASVTVYCA